MGAKYKTNHERMLELIEQLTKADIAYYRDDNPIMSDRDYDILMDELKAEPGWFFPVPRLKRCLEKSWKVLRKCVIPNRCCRQIRPSP